MQNQAWLPLNEYSIKYRISLSTLRRRIRSNEIKFRFEDGKYWLQDLPVAKHLRVHFGENNQNLVSNAMPSMPNIATTEFKKSEPETNQENLGTKVLLDGANKLLQEIKGAYSKILLEKEEQILQLKEEVADLRTLVKILESENDRLKANVIEAAPIDSWLQNSFEK